MKLILSILFMLTVSLTYSQARQFNHQYMLNPGFFNPANMDIFTKYGTTLAYTNDYVSSSNSPLNFALNSYYNYRSQYGFSGTIINDNYGGYNQLEVSANASYKTFSRSSGGISCAYGLRIGVSQHMLNTTKLNYESYSKYQTLDPVLGENASASKLGLNLGFGFALVTPKLDVNFSIPNLLGNRMPFVAGDTLNTSSQLFNMQNPNFFLTAGYKYRFDQDWYVFYPTIMVKGSVGAPIQAGVDFNFLLNQLIFIGAGVRTDLTIGSNLGVFLDNGWRVVYSYQNAMASIHPGTGFSHELTLGYGRTIPENPFHYKKFVANGDVKKSKKLFKIKMPKLRFIKKITGRMKYD